MRKFTRTLALTFALAPLFTGVNAFGGSATSGQGGTAVLSTYTWMRLANLRIAECSRAG